ncbi:acetamidase/formamidase family protein [Luteimonas sp. S4-F44]|uniref:acetamidase/formamidase family protein n=1 Tax=Luteimonas sp. S4-F44 TaxID=2925842 RepID=UPI001F52EEDF|nr:acetamidase/formamidase family protein [Luteimonas sp. S4-F44]UNK42673.1 acetamidase/formamidase family protein [Luteimonas sp. S4-F44]
MRLCLWALLLVLTALPAAAQHPDTWLLSIDRWGNAEHKLLTLQSSASGVSGDLDGWPVNGARQGTHLSVSAVDSHEVAYRFEVEVSGDRLTGWADYPDTSNQGPRVRHAVTGLRLTLPSGPPTRRVYAPTGYANAFDASRAPVLVIQPGDVVATRTVDSGGVDADGKVVALYGNPHTGPFFVAGAKAGDVLAVRIVRLRLNRDTADSLNGLTPRATSLGMVPQTAGLGQRVRWRLDREAGTARLEDPPERLRSYVVPVKPMLGGLAVAPDFGFGAPSTGDTGRWGGNMDFNRIVEGATVYLPVYQPGALLYLGDGHALQGDGETTQWALETSLDVEFSVEVLPGRALAAPRVEDATHLSVVGQASSLDEAVRAATAAMIQWLAQDYGLDVSEASMVLGTAAELRVVTLAGRNAGIALSLEKARLAGLAKEGRGSPGR